MNGFFSTACDYCAPGTASIEDVVDMLDEHKLNDEKIVRNVELFKKESLAWYEKLNANDQELVRNQINLIRQQKIANKFLTGLIESTETIKEEIKETQIIAQYAEPLDNLANTARLYNRIPKSKVGLLQNGDPLNHFKERALRKDKDGLYDSIDLAIQLFTGQGSHFHNGKSVFEYQTRYCKKPIYNYFIGRVTEGIVLYKTALKLNNKTISVPVLQDWIKGFVRIAEEYSR